MNRRLRNFVLKNAYLLGSNLSEKFIRFGYLIKSSKWYKNSKVDFYNDRNEMYKYLVVNEDLISQKIIYLEFGVSKGWGFHFWYETNTNLDSKFFGFDTFEGLPENWGKVKKGAYSANGNIPQINDNRCKFIVGLFQDTLDDFINTNELKTKKCILLDADLYNSTLFVLVKLHKYLLPGDILIFDEFFSVSKADHELRAFIDFLSIYKIEYKILAKTPNQIAIKII